VFTEIGDLAGVAQSVQPQLLQGIAGGSAITDIGIRTTIGSENVRNCSRSGGRIASESMAISLRLAISTISAQIFPCTTSNLMPNFSLNNAK
jgi:hypothetical protein